MKAAPLSKKQEKSLCLLIVRSVVVADSKTLHIQALLQIGGISIKEVCGMITFQKIA